MQASSLADQGYQLYSFVLDESIRKKVEQEKWLEVDEAFLELTRPKGLIYNHIQKFHPFSKIETMLSIRDAKNDYEEDGIWHDDGSRVFAFSLSLTLEASALEGGNLELRKKDGEESVMIPTPEFGTAILFLTGIHGYEHRTRQVTKGQRIILVGWCLE